VRVSIIADSIREHWQDLATRRLLVGWATLLLLDAFFLRWVFTHWNNWGFWDWDYQQTLFEVARVAIIQHGELPLWNQFLAGGVSLAGNTLNHVWAPCFAFVLAFGTTTAVKLCIPIYLILAQIGMWRLARERQMEPLGAFAAAAIFTLGGVFAQRLTHGHFEWIAIAWMPHVLVYIHRAGSGARPIWLGGLVFAFLFLDGGPYQFAFFGIFALVYAGALAWERRSINPLYALAIISLIGAGFAAIKLVPVSDIIAQTPRSTVDVNFYHAPFTPTAIEILQQMFVSRAQAHDPNLWMPYILNVGCYVGWVPLLLVAYAVMANPRRNGLWLAVGGGVLWIALGPAIPINLWALLHELPFFSALRVPIRFNVYVLLILALLAGEGLNQIARLSARREAGATHVHAIAAAILLLVAVDQAWVNGEIFRVAFSIPPIEVGERGEFSYYKKSPYTQIYEESALFPTHPNWKRKSAYPAVLENRGVIGAYRTVKTKPYVTSASSSRYRGEVWALDSPAARILEHEITLNTRRVRTNGRAAHIIFNSNYAPGWKTSTPGVEDPRPVHGLLAVEVPEGIHELEVHYRPPAFVLGAFISSVTIAIGVGSAFRGRYRNS